MNFKSMLLAALSLFGYAAIGQVQPPRVDLNYRYYDRLCAYAETALPVEITGKFNADNRFLVEILTDYNNTLIATYEAVLKNNNLVFTIGGEVQETSGRINFRVATTSPATKTSIYSNYWYSRGKISISRPLGESDTLNAGMGYPVNANAEGNSTITVTLSDSSIQYITPNGYQQQLNLVASKSTEIFIVKAVNGCDVPVPFSGKIPVVINPVSIIPVKVNNQTALCEGNEIELAYAVNGGTIPESATFRLRFFKPYVSSAGEKRIFEVPATKKANGVLVARIPQNLVASSNMTHVAVLVDKPGLVSPYLQSVSIYQKPTASFNSQSGSVGIGEAFGLGFNITGPKPHIVELSNGVSYALDDNRSAYVYPVKTETYSIRSLRTGCGVTTDLPKQNVVATVPAGIAINVPDNQNWALCENQKVRLPFITNTPLNANTKFTVEGSINYQETAYVFEAKLVNDSIEFLLPHSPAEWIKEGYFSIRGFRIKTSNPSLTSAYKYGFTIRGIPRVGYETPRPRTLTGPQYYEYTLNVSGGLPYTLITDQGVRDPFTYPSPVRIIYVPATGAYGLKSIENACYSNNDVARLNLTVNPYTSQAPAIVVHPPTQKYLCDVDSVEISFEAFGKFGEGNTFQILRSGGSYSAPLLTVNKPGKYKIAASALGGVPAYEWISVKSTNPEVHEGSRLPVILQTKPTLVEPDEPGSTPENPRIFGFDENPTLPALFKSFIPYLAEFTDGVKTHRFERSSEADYFTPVIPRSKVTPYTLKSLSNACGTLDVNRTTYFYGIGYRLSMDYFQEDQRFCTGQEMVVPFNVAKGSVPAGTKYHLQISKGAVNFGTVASQTTLEDFRYVVPDTMVGEYFVQIVTDIGVVAGAKRFFVNKIPTATVSLGEQPASEIEYGQSVSIDYNLTGNGPWEMIVSGQGNLTATSSPYTQYLGLARGTVFEIKSVSNQCGYGTVSGSVAVRVKPKIVGFLTEKTSFCTDERINVKYQVGGDIPAGEKIGFYLQNTNGTRFELALVSASAGTVSLAIPAALPGGGYELVCAINGTDIFESRGVSISKLPDLELSGITTINPGQAANLMIRSTNGGNGTIDVTLSDGTKSAHSFWGSGAYQYMNVKPSATTIYTIASATGSCGNAKVSGNATVTVNPPSAKTVRITAINRIDQFCEKDTLKIYYAITGTFSAGNQFTLQFYDKLGKLVNSLPTTGKEQPLRAIVPAGFSITEIYRVRLVASDANTAAGDYPQTANFGTRASAAFAGSVATLDKQGNAQGVVLLTGTGPWRYEYGSDLGKIPRYAEVSPDTLAMHSKEPSAYFKLLSVTNGCGAGIVLEPSTIRVEVITGTEEPGQAADPVAFGPNPTNGRVMLHFGTSAKRRLALYGTSGALIWTKSISGADAEVDMQQYPSGSYLLKIEQPKGTQTLKVVKE